MYRCRFELLHVNRCRFSTKPTLLFDLCKWDQQEAYIPISPFIMQVLMRTNASFSLTTHHAYLLSVSLHYRKIQDFQISLLSSLWVWMKVSWNKTAIMRTYMYFHLTAFQPLISGNNTLINYTRPEPHWLFPSIRCATANRGWQPAWSRLSPCYCLYVRSHVTLPDWWLWSLKVVFGLVVCRRGEAAATKVCMLYGCEYILILYNVLFISLWVTCIV